MNSTAVVNVIIDCLFQTVQRMQGGVFTFESELSRRGGQERIKNNFKSMLKNFRRYWRNRYSSIIVDVAQMALLVLNNWYYGSKAKLFRDKRMFKHGIEEYMKSLKYSIWSIQKVLCTNFV